MQKILLSLFMLVTFVSPTFATLTTIEFNNGDSLADWSIDRAAPSDYGIVNNQLQMDIGGPLNNNDFYNTQGIQLSFGSQANYLGVDMYVDSSWTTAERFGGLWGIGYSNLFDVNNWSGEGKTYPILEYKVDQAGDGAIAVWDSYYGWSASSDAFILDDFNRLEFFVTNSGIEYFINNNLVYVDSMSETEYLTGAILNAKNEGNPFTVLYDNLTYGNVDVAPVPEPSTMLLVGAGLGGLALYRRKNRK